MLLFQVFSSGRRETGGGFYRAGSSSLSLLPYFDMADLASSAPYIVSIKTFCVRCEGSLVHIFKIFKNV